MEQERIWAFKGLVYKNFIIFDTEGALYTWALFTRKRTLRGKLWAGWLIGSYKRSQRPSPWRSRCRSGRSSGAAAGRKRTRTHAPGAAGELLECHCHLSVAAALASLQGVHAQYPPLRHRHRSCSWGAYLGHCSWATFWSPVTPTQHRCVVACHACAGTPSRLAANRLSLCANLPRLCCWACPCLLTSHKRVDNWSHACACQRCGSWESKFSLGLHCHQRTGNCWPSLAAGRSVSHSARNCCFVLVRNFSWCQHQEVASYWPVPHGSQSEVHSLH